MKNHILIKNPTVSSDSKCKVVEEVVLKCGLQKLNLRRGEHRSTYG